MDDHLLQAVAALKDLMAARERGDFDKVAFFRMNGHGSLFIADRLDGGRQSIGDSGPVTQAADELKAICVQLSGKSFPKLPIGSPYGRNGEILRLALPILIKYLWPLLIAEAGPAIASAALLSALGE